MFKTRCKTKLVRSDCISVFSGKLMDFPILTDQPGFLFSQTFDCLTCEVIGFILRLQRGFSNNSAIPMSELR